VVKADIRVIENNAATLSERCSARCVRDSSARPDEAVRTGIARPCLRSLRARHKKIIAITKQSHAPFNNNKSALCFCLFLRPNRKTIDEK